jgi:hypothetical protein
VTTLLFDTATTSMRQSAVAALLLGIAVAVVSWLAGPFATPSRLRAAYRGSVDQLRRAASGHGLSTGRVGSWVTAQRRVLYVLVAIGAAAAILLLRPLTVSVVVTTAVAAMVALVLISLVERPAESRGPAGADVGYGRAAAG